MKSTYHANKIQTYPMPLTHLYNTLSTPQTFLPHITHIHY